MAKIIVFGTGAVAQLANYYFERDSEHEVVAFAVDAAYRKNESFEGKAVLTFETLQETHPPDLFKMFIATGYAQQNKVREQKYRAAKAKGYELVSYVSSRCAYLSQFSCGDNCFLLEHSIIQPFARIGNNVTLWSGSVICHHTIVEDHNFIGAQAAIAGHCRIGPNCFIGINATLHNGVTLGQESIVAAGAVVAKSGGNGSVFFPARTISHEKPSTEFRL